MNHAHVEAAENTNTAVVKTSDCCLKNRVMFGEIINTDTQLERKQKT